jgi:hypothetical protein
MRKLFILTTFISSLMMTSVAYAKWTYVGGSLRGDTYYVDFERIKKHNGRIYYWMLSDYIKPMINGMLSIKIYNEAECGSFRYRSLNATYYKGPMASGKIIGSGNSSKKEWGYPPPESSGEGVLKAVCNHKSMK